MSHGTSIGVKGRLFRAVENATRGLIFAGMVKPVPTGFVPAYGYEGMRYRGTITGTNLGTVTAVSLGVGITVDSFTIDSNTQISVIFRTGAAATAGYRDLTVYRGAIAGVLGDAFNLLVSDAITAQQKPPQQRMVQALVGKALVQYPYVKELVISARVQHTGHGVLPAQATIKHPYNQALIGQAIIQVRTSRLLDSQVQIQKMADIAGAAVVQDALAIELVSDRRLEMVGNVALSLEDRLSATLMDDTMEEA